jgi:hypothetical protein
MADSIREQIVQALFALLEGIVVASGYETDMGDNALRAKRSIAGALPAVSVFAGPEQSTRKSSATQQVMEVSCDCHGNRSSEDDDIIINRLLADVRKAVETYDATLAALVDGIHYTGAIPSYPEDGDGSISVSVRFELTYHTVRGDPYSQP